MVTLVIKHNECLGSQGFGTFMAFWSNTLWVVKSIAPSNESLCIIKLFMTSTTSEAAFMEISLSSLQNLLVEIDWLGATETSIDWLLLFWSQNILFHII